MIQLDDPGSQLGEFLIQFGLLLLELLLRRLPLGGLPAVLQLDLPQRQPLLLQLPVDLADLVDLQPSPLAPTRRTSGWYRWNCSQIWAGSEAVVCWSISSALGIP